MVLSMTIADKLRETREAKNLSLEEIQEKTKIQKRYLRAIEEGNFHILPGSFYARAFIKEYAQALGIDANQLLETHEDELPSIGERRSEAQYTRIQRTRRSSGHSRAIAFFSFLPTVIVILLVLIIIGLAIYFIQQKSFEPENNNVQNNEHNEYFRVDNDNVNDNENNMNNNENDESKNEENEETEEVNETIESTFEVSETNESVSPPQTTYQFIHDEDELLLSLQATDESWLDIDIDGEREFSSFISPENSPLEYNLTEQNEVRLNIGNASYVEITLNGVTLDYEIDENDHVYQLIIIQLTDEVE